MGSSQTKSMNPAEVLELVRRGVGERQLDAITQQVVLITSDSEALNELRRELAERQKSLKNFVRAAALFRAIAGGTTDTHGQARISEAECLVAAGQGAVALKAIDLVPEQRRSDPTVMDIKGRALDQLGRHDEAIACFREVLATGQVRSTTLFLLLGALMKVDRYEEATATLRQVLAAYPENADAWYNLSLVQHRMNLVEEAEESARKAIEIEPDNARFLFHRAVVLQVLGRIDEAEALANRGLELDPGNFGGLALFGTVHKYKSNSTELSRLERAMANLGEAAPRAQLNLLLAKARALEDVGDIEAAFSYYAALGRLKLKQVPYNPEEDKLLEGMRTAFTPEYVALDRSDRCQDNSPVFVLGMPRSGTSLLEQVLSSHSQVAGIGEQKIISRALGGMILNNRYQLAFAQHSYWQADENVTMRQRGEKYVEEARKAARKSYMRTVDKMPPNYRNLGIIFDILPNARIIHSMRHPIETCVSCYRILFGEGHAWSYDLRHLGIHYRRYFETMRFWDETLGDRILHVRYEDMVDDLEGQARRLFDYIDLPFEEQSLSFHENPNPMRTASVLQVRQPLYRTSIDRWRKHRDMLAPLYDEIEDIVEMYEKREGLFALAGVPARAEQGHATSLVQEL